jgi:2-polyprenyl-3-methyl-5-hydroxy-6-metoxy-1,4-benzoquinol methylase
MLNEYKNNKIWQENADTISLRSDVLVSARAVDLLGDIKGKKILDDGCGNGKVSRVLSKRGAIVYGVDKIVDQINVAKSIESNVTYFVSDMTELDKIELPKDFDITISLMTFLYLNKEQFVEALKQIKKHLRTGGRFIYANIHPSRYDGQFEVEDELPTIDGKIFKTTFYNHSLSFIKDSLVEVGFQIKEILEPIPTNDELERYPVLFSQKSEVPQYILIDTTLG